MMDKLIGWAFAGLFFGVMVLFLSLAYVLVVYERACHATQ